MNKPMTAGQLLVFLAWFGSLFVGVFVIPLWFWPRVSKWVGYTISTLFLTAEFAFMAAMMYEGARVQQEGTLLGFAVAGALVGLFSGLWWVVVVENRDRRRAKERSTRERSEQ